jgi:hypothetical protein
MRSVPVVEVSLLMDMEALALLGFGGLVAEVALRRTFPGIARRWERHIPNKPTGQIFRAYLALGLVPPLVVSFIAFLVSFFFFVTFVSGLLAFSVPWLIFASIFLAWSFHFFLSFVPVSFELTESALITHFTTGRITVRPWSEIKMAKVAGPLYAAGGKRWMVLGWFLIRNSRRFDAAMSLSLGKNRSA